MKISDVKKVLSAEVFCCEENLEEEIHSACGCDMMSDVLAYVKHQAVLLTGLVNPQVIKTAEMMDMRCIVFVRSKKPTQEMLELAQEGGLVVLATAHTLFEACGRLYDAGLRGEATPGR